MRGEAAGPGQTHLACAILSRVIADGYSGPCVTVSEAPRLIRSAELPGASQTEGQAFDRLFEPDLWVLDEVGVVTDDEGPQHALLFDVLNARCGKMRPTIRIGRLSVAQMSLPR